MLLPDITKRTTLLFVLTVAVQVFCTNIAEAQITKKADRKLAQKEYPEALQMYVKCLENKKINQATTIDVYHKMAQCYMAMNYYRPAYSYIRKAIAANSSNPEYYPLYCEALHCIGEYEKEISVYNKILSLNDPNLIAKDNGFVKMHFGARNNIMNINVSLSKQYAINTFGKDMGLAFLGGKFLYSTSGFLIDPQSSDYASQTSQFKVFSASYKNGMISDSRPEDKIPVLQGNNVTAIALHPSGTLYFVSLNGETFELYSSSMGKDSVYSSKKRVKIGNKKLPVESLTFSEDGNRMIFSAKMKGGIGGKDLWYSDLKNGEWQKPVNMGDKTNTPKDEITPFMYGSYLFFSSNGQPENFGGFDIYGIDLDPAKQSLPENLNMPYNSCADDFSLVINPEGNGGFLVSTRDTSLLDDKIYGFSHIPNFDLYRGYLTCNSERVQADAEIIISEKVSNKIITSSISADDSSFCFFLDNSKSYVVEIRATNFFPKTVEFPPVTGQGKSVENASKIQVIPIEGFVPNSAYKLNGVFNQTADSEIQESPELKSLLFFLKSNPKLDVYLHLFGYLSSKDQFNELLNDKRLTNLKNFLQDRGISKDRIKFQAYSNEIPTNYPPVDLKKDNTYTLYFVVTQRGKNTFHAKTQELKNKQ